MTVGIEEEKKTKKKTKNTSLFFQSAESTTNQTEHFSHFVSGANDDNLSEESPFPHRVKTTCTMMSNDGDITNLSEFSSSKIILRQKEIALKNHFLTV